MAEKIQNGEIQFDIVVEAGSISFIVYLGEAASESVIEVFSFPD